MDAERKDIDAARNANTLGRMVVFAHLLGVGAFGVVDRAWRMLPEDIARPVSSFAALYGQIALFVCPVLALWISRTGRLSPRDAAWLIILTCLIEATQVVALIPAIQ